MRSRLPLSLALALYLVGSAFAQYGDISDLKLVKASDKVDVTLHVGWNPLLLKITQNNQGWAFCVRIRNADGSHLDGVWCALTPKTASAGR